MKNLYRKTTQNWLENIHELDITGMTTNKEELVEVYGYSDISANYEAENNYHIIKFTYDTCTF